MNRKIKVAISQGDHNGIGLEVALKALEDEAILELMTPILFADWRLVEKTCRSFNIEIHGLKRIGSPEDAEEGSVNVVDLKLADITVEEGRPTKASGAGAVAAMGAALAAVTNGKADVLVTGPISKEAVQSDAFHYTGHTEYLADKTGAKAQMILFNDRLRVALVTTHLPISDISGAITREKVEDSIRRFAHSLKRDFGIERPKIAVLSLNPHCGDGGLLGKEEISEIGPAIESCISEGEVMAFGPYAADGFFGTGAYSKFDGVLAMYHDQGLAPFKTLAADMGVNFTAGLPIVRTSPDHGTAYDLAWKGVADPSSMREAIYKAIDIFRNRRNWENASANPLKKQSSERPQKGGRHQQGEEMPKTADAKAEVNESEKEHQ